MNVKEYSLNVLLIILSLSLLPAILYWIVVVNPVKKMIKNES